MNTARILDHLDRGDVDGALSVWRTIPPTELPEVLAVGADVLAEAGLVDEEMEVLRKLLAAWPHHAEAARRLSARLRAADRLVEASDVLLDALGHAEDQPGLWFDLSAVLLLRGATAGAVKAAKQTVALLPGDGLAIARRARALAAHGAVEQARADLKALRDGDVPDPAVWQEISRVYDLLGELDERVLCLECAVRLAPDDVPPMVDLAAALERIGRPDDARALAERAHRIDPLAIGPQRVLLRIAHHTGDLDGALSIGSRLLDVLPAGWVRQPTSLELARVHHRRGQAAEALALAAEGNNAALQGWLAEGHDANAFLVDIADAVHFGRRHVPPPAEDNNPPVFLVGFPRSGTTLTGQLLHAHPDLHTLDEMALLHEACRAIDLPTRPAGLGPRLQSPHVRRALRAAWRGRARAHGAVRGRPVHKLPLNLARVDLLRHLWPDAPFVLVVRDPRDAVISAVLQDFARSAAMSRLTGIAWAGDLYHRVMGAWLESSRRDGCRAATVRYEDLVVDPRAALEPVLASLDLSWHDDMLNWRAATSTAGVRTPSYRALQSDLSTQAVGRWRPYAEALDEEAPQLTAWAERFGYRRN